MVGGKLYAKRIRHFSCCLLPQSASRTGEQDEATIEQIQRGDALPIPLKPQMRHARSREPGQFLVREQRDLLLSRGRIFRNNCLGAIAIAHHWIKQRKVFVLCEQVEHNVLRQHRRARSGERLTSSKTSNRMTLSLVCF